MADTRKDVFLLGEPQPGVTRQQLVRNLAATFKKDSSVVEKMLAHPRFLIKRNVDVALAAKYEAAITKAGGMCELCHSESASEPDSESNSESDPVPGSDLDPATATAAPESAKPVLSNYPKADTAAKGKRRVIIASFFIFVLLLAVLVTIIFFQTSRPAENVSLPPDPAPPVSSLPSESSTVVLAQRIFSPDRRLSINVPEDWEERKNFTEGASIGASNKALEVYVIVMAESRADFSEEFTLNNYTDAVLVLLKDMMNTTRISPGVRSYKINGLPAEQIEIAGEVDGVGINYLLTTVESDKGFFHVLAWTKGSRFQANRLVMQEVSDSLVIRSFPAY